MQKIRNRTFIGLLSLALLLLTLLYVQATSVSISGEKEGAPTTTDAHPPSISGPLSATGELISVSFTPVEDYLPNPGIGWQQESSEESPYLPETVAYSERQAIAWKFLNPNEDEYNWSALDQQLHRAAVEGKQFSFRVYTMRSVDNDGNFIPDWVLQKGATLLASGEPDYSNCTYQEEWGKFVSELSRRYDGNPDIAFIDISGYGDFNEWSWQDNQTIWDNLWDQNYSNSTATPATLATLDGQARRRLVDMFIGGAFETHRCRDESGAVRTISYSYTGFQETQLVMPYAGIAQSTQYVFSRRPDVGFRYDCLGASTAGIVDRLGTELSALWKNAPIVFEFCAPDRFDLLLANETLQNFHGSLVHNNGYTWERDAIRSLMLNAGYRYFLKDAQLQIQKENKLSLSMNWQNVGLAPSYPRMGQTFQIHFYLINVKNQRTIDFPIATDVSAWMPAQAPGSPVPDNWINSILDLPTDLTPGTYEAKISIVGERTGKPINLVFSQPDELGRYFLKRFPIFFNATDMK